MCGIDHSITPILLPRVLLPKRHRLQPSALGPMPLPPLGRTRHTTDTRSARHASQQHRRPPAIHAPRREAEGCWGCWELLQAKLLGRYLLDWAALNTVSVACSNGDFLAEDARRHDDAAIAVVEEDVCAVGLGEAWCAFKEFFSIHDSRPGRDAQTRTRMTTPILRDHWGAFFTTTSPHIPMNRHD